MKKLFYSLAVVALMAPAINAAEDQKIVAKVATPASASVKVTADKTVDKNFSGVKIAFMEPYGVLDKSDEWKVVAETIKADIEQRTQKITKMTIDYQKKEAELKSMGNAVSPAAKEKKQKELLSLKNSIEIEQRAAQEIPQQQAQMAQMSMLKKVEAAANKIAKEYGIDIVLAGSTIYVADRIDITQLVADELNKNYKPAAKKVAA